MKQIYQSKKRLSKEPKTLSFNVVKRFLKEDELKMFLESYQANQVRGNGGSVRRITLMKPITKEEKELLEFYVKDLDTPVSEWGEGKGLPIGVIYGKAIRVAIRVIAQHNHILDEVVTED